MLLGWTMVRAMLLLLPGGSGGLHATGRSGGFGILGRSRRLGRSMGRGGRLGSGNYDGNRGRHDPLGWGCWFDVRNPVAMFVHADDDIHRLATVLVLDCHGVFAGVLHGHAFYSEAGELARVHGNDVLITGFYFLIALRPADKRFGVTADCAGQTQSLKKKTKNKCITHI